MIPATMEYMNIVQLLGYSASFIIFISLTMKSIVKLRILNAMGCLLFVIFALKTHSLPAVVMNIGIVIIDIYYFFKIVRVKDNFEILEVIKENEIVRYFFEKNKEELLSLFGETALEKSEKLAFYFRNTDIAGLIAYSVPKDGDGKTAAILIDFVVAKYRDLAIGRYFFIKNTAFWKNQGLTALTVEQPSEEHIPYLERLGFVRQPQTPLWKKQL